MARTGATLVPPYDDPRTMAGQGTIASLQSAASTYIRAADAGRLVLMLTQSPMEHLHLALERSPLRGCDARLTQLAPGERVLDLPCGHGRIAERLAEWGADVVGVDRCEDFLSHARTAAGRRGVAVDYRQGDWRTLAFNGEFDVVVCWFTSFGYGDGDGDSDEQLQAQAKRICELESKNKQLLEKGGGTGKSADWSRFSKFQKQDPEKKWIVAGGM